MFAGILVLLFCFYGGFALFWFGGAYDRGFKQEQLNGFKRAYALPRGKIMRFETREGDTFCRIHVSDEAALRHFMASRDSPKPWMQGNFTAGTTNAVEFIAKEFQLPKDELPDLGSQKLKWNAGGGGKQSYQQLLYKYLCVVDENTRTVWILHVSTRQ